MRGYGETARQHFSSPRNVGEVEAADGTGRVGTPGDGNYMVVTLKLELGCVAQIRYQTYGCPGAIVCGSAITELAAGRTVDEALGISPEDLLEYLGGLPLGKRHCLGLATTALRRALESAGVSHGG